MLLPGLGGLRHGRLGVWWPGRPPGTLSTNANRGFPPPSAYISRDGRKKGGLHHH
nr:hypothetical protein RVX_0604 [Nitratidesulfovibrio sp. HK-II]